MKMMMNTDNVESSLLASNLLKICCFVQVLLQFAHVELQSSVLYEVCCTSDKCGEHMALYRAIVYY